MLMNRLMLEGYGTREVEPITDILCSAVMTGSEYREGRKVRDWQWILFRNVLLQITHSAFTHPRRRGPSTHNR